MNSFAYKSASGPKPGDFKSTHVVVLGNEKGGSGKSTTAMHLIIALLGRGVAVGSIDLDSRQQSLTRYLENREDWARRKKLKLEMPDHYAVTIKDASGLETPEELDKKATIAFGEAVAALEKTSDFIVIDTPGTDNGLNRLAHSLADTLVTPLNDSFIDLDVIAHLDGKSYSVIRPSQYAEMVKQARLRRDGVDRGKIDWVVMCNRVSVPVSVHSQKIANALEQISGKLDFRLTKGVGERNIFRELFPRGLTLFDDLAKDGGLELSMSHLAAREEVRAMLHSIELPIEDFIAVEPDEKAPDFEAIFEAS